MPLDPSPHCHYKAVHHLGASGSERVLIAHIKPRGFIPKNMVKYVKMVVLITLKGIKLCRLIAKTNTRFQSAAPRL